MSETYIGKVFFQGFGEATGTTGMMSFTGVLAAAIDVQSLSITYDDNIVRFRQGGKVTGMYSPERTIRISMQCQIVSHSANTEAELNGNFRLPGSVSGSIGAMCVGTFAADAFTAEAGWLNSKAGAIVSGAYNLQHNDPNQFTIEWEHNPNLSHSVVVTV